MTPSLSEPNSTPLTPERRAAEIDKICAGFVAPGEANRAIYRALLECLLPEGAGVPGPIVTEDEVRAAVESIKPRYKDVFRRMRELQGEEGLTGIKKVGVRYQLTHLAVEAKRVPRKPIPKTTGQRVILDQGNRCNVCGEPITLDMDGVEVDHRKPRSRGGSHSDANLQVICGTCNVMKSTQCTGCTLNCGTCAWAHPEQYRPVKLRPDIVERINRIASDRNEAVDNLANNLLDQALENL